MTLSPRRPAESAVTMTYIVFPDDTNPLGFLRGGQLLHWMDLAAALVATRHCGRACVTVSVDNVSFCRPINVGDVVIIRARITRAFTTSMEVYVHVQGENPIQGKQYQATEAFYTMVAVDSAGKPIPVPPVQPETPEEQAMYESARIRRLFRLFLAGRTRIDAQDLEELLNTLRRTTSEIQRRAQTQHQSQAQTHSSTGTHSSSR